MSKRERVPPQGKIICAEYFIFEEPFCEDHRKILDGTVAAFIKAEECINSECDNEVGKRKKSDKVLEIVGKHLDHEDWEIEEPGNRIKEWTPDNMVKINPDARYKGKEGDMKAILEVEGPRAWVASAWAKDLTKAMKTKQDYLILAVRKHYKAGSAKKPSNDFKRIGDELAYLNCLPLKAVLLIGY